MINQNYKSKIFSYRYRINVTGENSRISEYHKSTLGIYTRVRERLEDGFTAPVYRKGREYSFKITKSIIQSENKA